MEAACRCSYQALGGAVDPERDTALVRQLSAAYEYVRLPSPAEPTAAATGSAVGTCAPCLLARGIIDLGAGSALAWPWHARPSRLACRHTLRSSWPHALHAVLCCAVVQMQGPGVWDLLPNVTNPMLLVGVHAF